MKVSIINGKGYLKYLFSELGLAGNEEFSLFFWKDGTSPAHDHSVDEITYIVTLEGKFSEIRKVGSELVTTFYHEGQQFDVPAGTEHVIQVEGTAVTVNFCKGQLHMNVLKDFLQSLQQPA